LDVEKILVEAAQRNVMIEINANPHRLDLDWVFCKRAKALGVTLVINPDAHDVDGFADMRYGVLNARRGWVEAGDVFNTLPPETIAQQLLARRNGA
jgi:DNA polymerase (family 10)